MSALNKGILQKSLYLLPFSIVDIDLDRGEAAEFKTDIGLRIEGIRVVGNIGYQRFRLGWDI